MKPAALDSGEGIDSLLSKFIVDWEFLLWLKRNKGDFRGEILYLNRDRFWPLINIKGKGYQFWSQLLPRYFLLGALDRAHSGSGMAKADVSPRGAHLDSLIAIRRY